MSRQLPGSPDTLLGAARVLLAEGGELRERAGRTVAASRPVGWEGTAALAAAARAEEAARSLRAQAGQLDQLARSTSRYAERLRDAQQQERVLQCRRDRARVELDRLDRAAGAGVDPAQQARRQSLAHDVAVLRGRIERLAGSLEPDGQSLVRVLSLDPLTLLPGWAVGGVALASGGISARTVVKRARATTSLARHARRWRRVLRAGDALGSLRHLTEAGEQLEVLRGKSGTLDRVVRRLPATARWAGRFGALPITVYDGVRDVVTGGHHEDWREPVTRVMGGVGAGVAITLMVAGAASPLAPVAGAALAAYGAWTLGNAVWDNRREIGAFVGRVGTLARSAFRAHRRSARQVARRAAETVRSAVRLGEQALDRVGEGVGRVLRDLHLPDLSLGSPW